MSAHTKKHNLEDAPKTFPMTTNPCVAIKTPKLMITYPFDLRGLSPKQDTLRDTPLCQGWMVFLNKNRTLTHIMHQLDAAEGSYVRMKAPVKIAKDASIEE